jgi:DNA-binding NarL/FixJ family response regulator
MVNPSEITVVLADEFALVREGIACLCERLERFRVVGQAGDGVTALELIRVRQPDIAIVDLQLPRLFSLEMIRKSRELQLTTRYLVSAARGDRKSALEALRAGANGFVLKSASAAQLADALRSVSAGTVYVSPELKFEKVFIGSRDLRPTDPIDSLSSREYQVFRLLIDGVRAKEIAARLDLSPKTVDTYRASLMRKLDIHDVAGLVKFAIQREMTAL